MASQPQPPLGARERRIMLTLMTTAYTLNFVDRTIIASIGQAIKADLKITDTQLGLLGGLYFALLYTFLGLPLARFAERYSRRNIIAGAILVWSGFTALCGSAASYAWLALFRFGVGVGEAGLSPPAHSLISDYYEPKKRASALSVYSLGVPIGTMVGAVVGGFLAQRYGWRVAFLAAGLPGVLLAIAIWTLVREPVRPAKPPSAGFAAELRATLGVARGLFGSWPVFNMIMGITLVSFAGYGGGQFVQPYFTRAFGLNYAQVGLLTGLIGATSQIVGVLLGGFASDRLARSGARQWYGLVPAIGVTLAFPFILGIYTADSWQAAAVWLAFPGALSYVYLGPTYGVVQNAVAPEQRATATAVLLFFLNLVALGGGPPFTGWLIDHFATFHFFHPDQPHLLAAVGQLFGDAAGFQSACPGGAGAVTGSATDRACKASVVLATRQGVLVAYGVGLWGAFHYLLAGIALRRAPLPAV